VDVVVDIVVDVVVDVAVDVAADFVAKSIRSRAAPTSQADGKASPLLLF
jgi:hypothetical protein